MAKISYFSEKVHFGGLKMALLERIFPKNFPRRLRRRTVAYPTPGGGGLGPLAYLSPALGSIYHPPGG